MENHTSDVTRIINILDEVGFPFHSMCFSDDGDDISSLHVRIDRVVDEKHRIVQRFREEGITPDILHSERDGHFSTVTFYGMSKEGRWSVFRAL